MSVVALRTQATRPLELAPQQRSFDFLESKIRPPDLRRGTVSRTALVNRLRATTSRGVVTLVAPAGYGKTTLLAQWAARERRRLAWVTLDTRDNDPLVLLRHIAAALELDEPLGTCLLDALEEAGSSIWTKALPGLAVELSARAPIVLVLDDFELLHSRSSLDVIAALVDDEPESSVLVVAGRKPPRLSLAMLRASGRLLELSASDLAMSSREAQLLLRECRAPLSADRVPELVEKCEGWPAALSLAAQSICDGGKAVDEKVRLSGDNRDLADYFHSECLAHARPALLRFLRRTSVLERMSGPLCDAMLRNVGSAQELRKIERANLFLVPLDQQREWYRYHPLFRDLLHRELVEHEPEIVSNLHSRAADWFEAQGDAMSTLEHAYAAGETARAAAILTEHMLPLYCSARAAAVERWLTRFERAGLLPEYPAVATLGCWIHALRGRPEQAEQWLEAATRGSFRGRLPDGARTIEPWLATLRAWFCRQGPKQMLADAESAAAGLPASSCWCSAALLAEGAALMLLGEPERADAVFAQAAEAASVAGAAESHVVALGERALIAAEMGEHDRADVFACELRELVASSGVEGYLAQSFDRVIAARTMFRHGRWDEARAALAAGQNLAPFLTTAVPWLAIQVRLELVRGFLTLRDTATARQLLEGADEMLRASSGLGSLQARADELRREADVTARADGAHEVGLTRAECRVLPLLATNLTFKEIGEEFHVSRNTIKAQAISVYRKLGVSRRGDAVAEARRLGLSEHPYAMVTSDR